MGAGTSKCAGAPQMADFLDRAESLLQNGSVNEVSDEFGKVFDAIGKLQAVHSPWHQKRAASDATETSHALPSA